MSEGHGDDASRARTGFVQPGDDKVVCGDDEEYEPGVAGADGVNVLRHETRGCVPVATCAGRSVKFLCG